MAGDGELFMDNLEEFVYDEDRIVTYKWLSRTLTVTANQAKQMLYAFLTTQQEKKNKPQLSVTYLVGGRILQHGEMCSQYVLTTDDRLEETKSQFDPVTSVHIYSIQKQTLKDSNSLYMVDYDISREHKHEENRWSHIYCKEAARLGDGGESRAAAGRSALGKENSHPGLKTANGHSSSATDVQKNKAPPQKSKKGQLPTMGMFAVKTEKKPEPKAEPVKPPETKKQDKSNSGGMLSFFGKPTAGQSRKTEAKQEKIEKKSQEQKPKEEKIHEKESATSNEKKEQEKERNKSEGKPKPRSEKEKQPTRKRVKKFESSDEEEPLPSRITAAGKDLDSEEDEQPIKSKSEKKSRKKSNDNKRKKSTTSKQSTRKSSLEDEPAGEKTKQKRKRAKNVLSDESTDDESPQASEQSVISETPVAEQQTKPRVSESAKRRKRQKVLHSKTYMNDEGFMVTEKVYESESTDASDEEPVEVKPAEPKKTSPQANKKAPDPKSAKQSSLMSFFGKK
ncbi:DNA polymerase delta subunit 3 isoform X2 [Nematostella vectensis]|uniref:DNA polymerase delta subunit 3 isoform X2 n=1 Tax=Nematostella vectensis TaxID=45351 RepID=UPI002077804D|nr:DNA polymerase delta subunit 3 isoform X2 [Nematostella vectensis]